MEQIKAAGGSFRHAFQDLLELVFGIVSERFMLWHTFLSRLSISLYWSCCILDNWNSLCLSNLLLYS